MKPPVKVRKTWHIDPTEKVHRTKKEYHRSREKQNVWDDLDEEDGGDNFKFWEKHE